MRYYTHDHEWLKIEGDIGIVGITEHATQALGDIVYFEPKVVGAHLKKGDVAAVIESVKAASDIYAPLAGVVVEINANTMEKPESINAAPLEEGWLFKLRLDDPTGVSALLSKQAYDATIGQR